MEQIRDAETHTSTSLDASSYLKIVGPDKREYHLRSHFHDKERPSWVNAHGIDTLLPKSHHTPRSWLRTIYNRHFDALKTEILAKPNKIHISFDRWSSPGTAAFFAVVAHYFDQLRIFQTKLLALPRIKGTHNGENLAKGVIEVVKRFSFESKLAAQENALRRPRVKEGFESELSAPEKLVAPTRGWKLTSSITGGFPTITPLPASKLAAVRSEDCKMHVFYQSSDDTSIHKPAKPGTPLTAVSGGWSEVRLFYVTPGDILAGGYSDDHTKRMGNTGFTLTPNAMMSAVAWNYASPSFQIRIYTNTDEREDLYELSFSRNANWALRCVSKTAADRLVPLAMSKNTPLSAVAAIVVDEAPKVYFHPRRTIAEWDVSSAASSSCSGIPKIKEEKQRRLKEREEEERKRVKPVLPNTVTLRNPIAIMGSLQGAPVDIDDVFQKVDLPFPVYLYNHASTTVWVTDTGMLCLDKSRHARDNRHGKPLPCREPEIPPYTMFPFWTDLKICKGKPQGIYYEISGETPDRKFTVEWYVTRYRQESQYFHFNLLLEEAKPNVVTFKYYDIVDMGKECTVGVQGPEYEMMFSHNETIVHKGLTIVFDTASNTMVKDVFPV
ncbi:hypothetical protein QBC46DRAFT_342996 [Diplogelasinospora grovesii]|uniref:Uncharacterized protein n=1 Tax=Diplogelasinospora grovesii TaxID=303347 RepID=A0AAN6N4C9_9PEZI|nr:hypothetical protein QBC46DRAFT_342996 [Diplogelasinospora grovesii]